MTDTASHTLLTLLKIEHLNPEEQADFVDDMGSVLLEAAALRYLEEATEADQEAFTTFMEKHAEAENLLDDVIAAFPAFADALQSESAALQAEIQAIVGVGGK